MPDLDPSTVAMFMRLATHCGAGAAVCRAVEQGRFREPMSVRQICTAGGISQSRGDEVIQFLHESHALGLVSQQTELTWFVTKRELLVALAPLLAGACMYKDKIHQDEDIVQVVLTMPPAPSRVADALEDTLRGSWGLIDTKEVLPSVAEAAKVRFLVMTPYLDEVGAPIVLNLFQRARCSSKVLITRALPGGAPPPGLALIADQLCALSVETLNFRVRRSEGSGTETCHAKVVLADDTKAYVGSFNMNRWSADYSLELGVYVTGEASRKIARVVDAIAAVSAPF